jgi:hypothetical protein
MSQPVQGDQDQTGSISKPGLFVVPTLLEPTSPLNASIWPGDPNIMSPNDTSLEDWPRERDFTPLIKAAFASGDVALVKQLREDQEFCATMRRKLLRAAKLKHVEGR